MVSFDIKIVLYIFIYKCLQQYVFVDIIKDANFLQVDQFIPRVSALVTNLITSIALEIYFKSKTFKKSILALYTSLFIILLNVLRQIHVHEIAIFILNLTVCESIIYNNFLRLWIIHLCVDLAILYNYLTNNILLHLSDYNIRMYVFWISSLLFCNTPIDKRDRSRSMERTNSSNNSDTEDNNNTNNNTNNNENENINNNGNSEVRVIVDNNRHCGVRVRLKAFTYIVLQCTAAVGHIFIGCSTIRYNIFHIFVEPTSLRKTDVTVLLIIVCSITIISSNTIKLRRESKAYIIFSLVLFNYVVFVFLKILQTNKNYKYYTFFIDIIMKKSLGICKCCMSSFILEDRNRSKYKGNKSLVFKFFILNSDSLSFIVNHIIGDVVYVNIINIFIVTFMLLLYKLFIYL